MNNERVSERENKIENDECERLRMCYRSGLFKRELECLMLSRVDELFVMDTEAVGCGHI